MDNTKINLEQQQEVREINIKLNLGLTDDFICNCTLSDYLSLVEFKEDTKQYCEQDTRQYNEPSYRIRPIDAKGNAKK